jgi:hypothetical protein
MAVTCFPEVLGAGQPVVSKTEFVSRQRQGFHEQAYPLEPEGNVGLAQLGLLQQGQERCSGETLA